MCKFCCKKYLHLIILIYLIFAVPASFTFSIVEALHLNDKYIDDKIENSSVINEKHSLNSIVWKGVEIIPNTRVFGSSYLILRGALLRGFILLIGACTAVLCFKKSHFPIVRNNNTLIYKNYILLKLRI